MNVAPMLLGLPRKKSAPALLFYPLPLLDANYDVQSELDRSCPPRSRSAPVVSITEENLLYRKLERGNTDEKENQGAAIDVDPKRNLERLPTTQTVTNLTDRTTSGVDSENHLQNPQFPLRRSGARTLATLLRHSNQLSLGLPVPPSTQGLSYPSLKKPLEEVSNNDEKTTAQSSLISKRLSSRCLRAFQRPRPSPIFPPNYHLNTNNTDNLRIRDSAHHSRSSSSISPLTSVIFTSTRGDFMLPNEKGPFQCSVSLESRAANTTLDEPFNCDFLLQEQKNIHSSYQETSLDIIKSPPNPSTKRESDQCRSIDCVTAGNLTRPTVPTEDCEGDLESNGYDKTQRSYNEGYYKLQSSSTEAQPTEVTGTHLNLHEAIKGLEPNHQRFVYNAGHTKITKTEPKASDCIEKKPEGANPKKSRLAVWRHRKPGPSEPPKTGFRNWLGKRKNEATATSKASGKTNQETIGLKKSPSLLFRLLNSMAPESVPEGQQVKYSGGISTATQQKPSNPLLEHYAATSKIKKEQEQAPTEAGELPSCGIVNEDTVMTKGSRKDEVDALEALWPGDNFMGDTPGPDITAGRRWEAEKFGDSGERLKQVIGEGEIMIEDFPDSRRPEKCYPILSPNDLHTTSSEPISLNFAKPVGVSWNGSIQEYAGTLGHVCPSGERPVSDTFRSIDLSRSGSATNRTHNLAPLKNKTGFGEGPEFEESSLAADWDVAMRMMEEFSKTERKLKRAGAIKHRPGGGGGGVGSAGCGKDGIGRSFSNDGRIMSVVFDAPTRLLKPELEDYEDSENEITVGETPCMVSGSLVYKGTERAYSFEE